jgi:hypothetical protein
LFCVLTLVFSVSLVSLVAKAVGQFHRADEEYRNSNASGNRAAQAPSL